MVFHRKREDSTDTEAPPLNGVSGRYRFSLKGLMYFLIAVGSGGVVWNTSYTAYLKPQPINYVTQAEHLQLITSIDKLTETTKTLAGVDQAASNRLDMVEKHQSSTDQRVNGIDNRLKSVERKNGT